MSVCETERVRDQETERERAQVSKQVTQTETDLLLHVLVGEEVELLPVDLLLVEHLLVVDLLDEGRVVNAIGLQELHVGDLEGLANGLGYQLGLQHTHTGRSITGAITGNSM